MSIANNPKAFHDYFVENKFEAGLVLQGWEVKSIRARKVQLKDSYVKVKNSEIWLMGCHITPLISSSTHIKADPTRSRKLLLSRHEIDKLTGKVTEKGYSIVALSMYFKGGKVKVEIATAKGKKLHDKRGSEKEKELNREKDQAIKNIRTRM